MPISYNLAHTLGYYLVIWARPRGAFKTRPLFTVVPSEQVMIAIDSRRVYMYMWKAIIPQISSRDWVVKGSKRLTCVEQPASYYTLLYLLRTIET